MCGICGIINYNPGQKIDKELLKAINNSLRHRGPDDEGLFAENNVGLAMKRLSIIDLKGGRQPVYNEDKTAVAVFNGEIYNYVGLRRELIEKGHIFKSNSDTEVIVHLYEEYGPDFIGKLNGMFAIALYDKTKGVLYLIRDRFGIKPLYYCVINNNMYFASEIKAFLQIPGFNKEINFKSISNYLTLRYIPGTETVFNSVLNVPPGSYLKYCLKTNEHKITKYWVLTKRNYDKISFDEAFFEFNELLSDSVRLRLISDVPVGLFLSGGVDSASIAFKLKELGQRDLDAFTVFFDREWSELDKASYVSGLLNINLHSTRVTPDDFDKLEKIVYSLDQPFGDAIVVPIDKLAETASKKVKVVLCGEGADEILFGYIHHKYLHLINKRSGIFFKTLTKTLSRVLPFFPERMLNYFFPYPDALGAEGKRKIASLLGNFGDLKSNYTEFISLFGEREKELLIKNPKLKGHGLDIPDSVNLTDYYENDINRWLPDNILFKQDRLTMAHSIEGRVPYLDHRLAEFAFSLPLRLKFGKGTQKFILNEILRSDLKKIDKTKNYNNKKQAFYMPLDREYDRKFVFLIDKYLNKKKVAERNLFNYGYIEKIIRERNKSKLLNNKKIISLIMLEIWLEKFYGGNF